MLDEMPMDSLQLAYKAFSKPKSKLRRTHLHVRFSLIFFNASKVCTVIQDIICIGNRMGPSKIKD